MQVIRIGSFNPDTRIVKKATEILRLGGIIVYPTDTTYALGTNASDPVSVLKV